MSAPTVSDRPWGGVAMTISRICAAVLTPVLLAGAVGLAGVGTADAAPGAAGAAATATATAATGTTQPRLADVVGLPMPNRRADAGPGGVHPALPTDSVALGRLVDEARASGRSPAEWAALLQQYRLVQACEEAGIDLASWDPARGFAPNREAMTRSYRYYEDFQLSRRELQWAGMGGMVGGDFGGGVADLEWFTDLYATPGVQEQARGIIEQVRAAFGPAAVEQLPGGLRLVADRAHELTTDDLRWFVARVMIMQKAIYSDLMPMHHTYVHHGLPGLEEMHRAGLFGPDIMAAWRDVASGDPDRVAAGNTALLEREQGWVVADMWDRVREGRDGKGAAFTFVMTLAGSPSIVGVRPLREFRTVSVEGRLPDGRAATLHTPIPDWDWSVFEERWAWVSTELLPRYRHTVENDWPRLEAQLRVPYEQQFESQRATRNIPRILGDMAAATHLTVH